VDLSKAYPGLNPIINFEGTSLTTPTGDLLARFHPEKLIFVPAVADTQIERYCTTAHHGAPDRVTFKGGKFDPITPSCMEFESRGVVLTPSPRRTIIRLPNGASFSAYFSNPSNYSR
jgi:hypothetical protein